MSASEPPGSTTDPGYRSWQPGGAASKAAELVVAGSCLVGHNPQAPASLAQLVEHFTGDESMALPRAPGVFPASSKTPGGRSLSFQGTRGGFPASRVARDYSLCPSIASLPRLGTVDISPGHAPQAKSVRIDLLFHRERPIPKAWDHAPPSARAPCLLSPSSSRSSTLWG